MKLEKSDKSMAAKRGRHMGTREGAQSYEEYSGVYPSPTGTPGESITIKTIEGEEKFYCWVFYEEDIDIIDPNNNEKIKFHFEKEAEQERYEWFCGGWIQFYDEVVRKKDIEHKLFFYWDKSHPKGVGIYINDELAIKNRDKDINLSYTPPTAATGDPPTVPPPPPPSSK